MAAVRIAALNRSWVQACCKRVASKTDVESRRCISSEHQSNKFNSKVQNSVNVTRVIPRDVYSGYLTHQRYYRAAPYSERKGSYIVNVKTGDQLHAGTDAAVSIILHSTSGDQTAPIKLDYPFRDDFERGQLDQFKLKHLKHIPDVHKIEIFRGAAPVSSDWFVDYINIECTGSGEEYMFPVFRWIKPNRRYVIHHMDNCLPQLDPEPQYRAEELEEKKTTYQVKMKVPGGPAQGKIDDISSREHRT